MWTNPQETANLVTFTEEIFNEKLHFLCSDCVLHCTLLEYNWELNCLLNITAHFLNTTTHFLLTVYKHNVASFFNMTVHFLHNTEHFLNRITVSFLNISAHFLNNTVDFLNSAAHFMTLIQLNLIFHKSININLNSFYENCRVNNNQRLSSITLIVIFDKNTKDRTWFISLAVLLQDCVLRWTVVLLLFLQVHKCSDIRNACKI